MNTASRAICTIVAVFLLHVVASAQSTLNFATRGMTGIAITNAASFAADVKFTLYNSDGSQATTPVSRRVSGKGQVTVFPSQIFRLKEQAEDTWIQATSSVTGLQGFYFSGDFVNKFEGAEATEPLSQQTIPYISREPGVTTSLLVTNPTSQTASITLTYFDSRGMVVATTEDTFPIAPHRQLVFEAQPPAVSARVSSDVGVLVSEIEESESSLVLISGQGPKSQGQRLVAPFFKNRDNTRSRLILTNPNASEVDATVTFFTDFGVHVTRPAFHIAANGSLDLDWSAISGLLIPNAGEGWLLVETTAPTGGIVLVSSGSSRTALPLQPSPADRMLFSRFAEGDAFSSSLSLVGSAEGKADVVVTLVRQDGTTIAKRELTIPPLFRVQARIRDLVPIDDDSSGYLTVQSSVPINAIELMTTKDSLEETGVVPQRLPAGFQANPVGAPRIDQVTEIPDAPFGVRRIQITGGNIPPNATLSVNGRVVPMTALSPLGDKYSVDLPVSSDPGFVSLKIHANGMDSKVETLDSVFPEDAAFIRREGQAMFQKVEVTEAGLDPSRIVLVPIRNARVEVFDKVSNQVVSVSETDDQGWFVIGVPDLNNLTLRVLSRLRSSDVKVLDNTAAGRPLYMLTKDIGDQRNTDEVFELTDATRQAGAFNILDDIQRGNALLAQADPQLVPPPLTILWSQNNNESVLSRLTGGFIKTTLFYLPTNTAYVLGDRATDSDEFDDSVILHEYAHMLAGRFSRDDSPGGTHFMGDILDPRVAWSEGWANFFSGAVRGTAVYVDSKGPGVPTIRFDLEENVPPNDHPGYRSEASVGGLLWDLLDENADKDDPAQFPFAAIWAAFTDLRNFRYVYLPDFLETFLARNPGFSDAMRTMVAARGMIDFQPDERPSVAIPFPRPIRVGDSLVGEEVDSFTSKRTNLAMSSHYYTFTTTIAGVATITLNITGLGPANNANANDLDLYLLDSNGKRLERSDNPFNGQPEMITGRLNPGTYYVEVRSYYNVAGTSTTVYNSGTYRLTVQLQ